MSNTRFRVALPRGRRLITAVTIAAAAIAVGAPPAYANLEARVDLKVLVVTDGQANVTTMTDQLIREGVPYQVVDTRTPGRQVINADFLSGNVGRPQAKFQAVILPDTTTLPAAERTALTTFEKQFKIRELIAYTWARPEVGLQSGGWAGTIDGMIATVTNEAKKDGFVYLTGQVPIDDNSPVVGEAYADIAAPVSPLPAGSSFTPYVTMAVPGAPSGTPAGVVGGVYSHDGLESMVLTLSLETNQNQSRVLAHGILEWLTRGIYVGYWRNYLSVHVDDIFLSNDRWQRPAVAGAILPEAMPQLTDAPTVRMTATDLDYLLAWQQKTGINLDLAFNAMGSVEAGTNDPLTKAMLAHKAELRWLSHTYSHKYLGCVRDASRHCAVDPDTEEITWTNQSVIDSEIAQNLAWAKKNNLPINPTELVTGEHSGLRRLPEETVDNPNLAPSLKANGVLALAADNSIDPASRPVGAAVTVPRYPMNIYFNAASKAEEVDEFNWLFTSRQSGGSGNCERGTDTSACITPLAGPQAFDSTIVPSEARVMLRHMISNDPRPHYVHQSNLAEDRLVYPVIDAAMAQYRTIYARNATLLNPTMTEAAELLQTATAWNNLAASGAVEAYRIGDRVTVLNHSAARIDVPLTTPNTTVVRRTSGGRALGLIDNGHYAGSASGWSTVTARTPLVVAARG